MSKVKKIIVSVILAFFLLTTTFIPSTKAQQQGNWYLQDYQDWYARVYDQSNPDEVFGERYTAAQVEWVIYGLIAFLNNHILGNEMADVTSCLINANGDPLRCLQEIGDLFNNPLFKLASSAPQNATYYANSNVHPIRLLFSSPISGIGYFKEKFLVNSTFVPEVKAQGFGFMTAAAPIQTMWKVARNISYFFMVIVIIALAFAIMFRVKLSPQTVVTVELMLPKLILTLILITFSYAIAGFMIDLMYVALGLIAALFSQSGLFDLTWADAFTNLAGLTTNLFSLLLAYIIWFILATLTHIINNEILTTIIGIIFLVVVLIVCIFLLFRIAFLLLKTYFIILLLIIGGPFIILGGLLGGRGFGGWLRNLIANLGVFVAVGPMFAFAFLFVASSFQPGIINEILKFLIEKLGIQLPFSPKLEVFSNPEWYPPFAGGVNVNYFWLIGSLVILTLIPHLNNILRTAILGGEFKYGTAIGETLKPPAIATGTHVYEELTSGANTRLGQIGITLRVDQQGSVQRRLLDEIARALQIQTRRRE